MFSEGVLMPRRPCGWRCGVSECGGGCPLQMEDHREKYSVNLPILN